MTTARIAATDPGMDVTLGERVHQLMWRAKLSQTAVAPKLGISQAALSKKLRGDRGWSLDEVVTVARLFDVSVGYLFGETENPHQSPSGGSKVGPAGFDPTTSTVKTGNKIAEIIPLFGAAA